MTAESAPLELQLWVRAAKQLVMVSDGSKSPLFGAEMNNLAAIADGNIGAAAGKIVYAGADVTPPSPYFIGDRTTIVDAGGCVVTPGLIDCHTHIVFAGSREDEFTQKIQGIPYLEIARKGGGIRRTVRQTRATSADELIETAITRIVEAVSMGITTIEIKTGYGLSYEEELRLLEVIQQVKKAVPVRVVATLLAAHEIPEESSKETYLEMIAEQLIPIVAQSGLADFCDVFCERGVYSVAETRRVLEAAAAHGLKLKIHAEQLSRFGGSILAGELHATSADHLDHVDLEGIRALNDGGVVPVLLPGCNFFMGLKHYPPAKDMLSAGLPVALATDFNPGSCMTQNLPLIMTIAATQLRMTPAECLAACTVNAAAALDLHRQCGVIAPGYAADLAVWGIPSLDYLPYHFGRNHVRQVIIGGKTVVDKS